MTSHQPAHTRRHKYRTVRLEVRLTPEEAKELSEKAEALDMSLSEVMRLAALGQFKYERDMVDTMTTALGKTIEEMGNRLIDAMVEGLAVVMQTVTRQPVPEGLLDHMADEMRDAYRPDESDEAGEETE